MSGNMEPPSFIVFPVGPLDEATGSFNISSVRAPWWMLSGAAGPLLNLLIGKEEGGAHRSRALLEEIWQQDIKQQRLGLRI